MRRTTVGTTDSEQPSGTRAPHAPAAGRLARFRWLRWLWLELATPGSKHLALGFFAAAAAIVPWTVYLAFTLPKHYSAHYYWLGWTGFDVALIGALFVTGLALERGDVAVHRYSSVVATMLVVDAWFNVLNAESRTDRLAAIAMAAVVELPLAYVCWRIARSETVPPPLTSAENDS